MGNRDQTADLEPKHSTGLLLLGCMVLALTVVFFKALFTCKFILGGDPALFIRDVGLVNQGYLQANLDALRGASGGNAAGHVQFVTEAGFVFILWLVSHLGWQVPFYINAFFLTAAIAGLCLLFRELVWEKSWADLATGLVLLLLVAAPVYAPLLLLAWPFRDTSALCFGFWGLYFLLVAVRTARGKTWRLGLSGLLLGFVAWLRMPNIVLVVPAGVYLVWHTLRQARHGGRRQRISLTVGILLWGAMVMVGPGCVVVQGILETGRLAVPGRANASLVPVPAERTVDPTVATSHLLRSGLHKGLHWDNASNTLKGVWKQVGANQFTRSSWGVWILLGFGALFCRRALLGLAFAAPLMVLYGSYDKVVLRYNIPAMLLVGGALSCSLAALIYWLFHRVRRIRPLLEGPVAGAVVLVIAALLSMPNRDEVRCFVAERDAALSIVGWLENTTEKYGAMVTSWPGLASLVALVSPETFVVQGWVSGHLLGPPNPQRRGPSPDYFRRDRDARVNYERIVKLLDDGGMALFVLLRNSEGQASDSWVKDDLMHSFHLATRPGLSVGNESQKTGLIAYEIQPASLGPRRMAIPLDKQGPALLLAHLRSLCGTNESQVATVISGDHRVEVALEAGLNLIAVPETGGDHTVELVGQTPLPSTVWTAPMGVEPVLVDLGEYRHAPSNIRMVEGFRIEWSGFDKWFRDWGGDGRKNHKSRPHFFLQADTNNRLKLAHPVQPYVLRLNYRIGLRQRSPGWEAEALRYSLEGRRMMPVHECGYPYKEDYALKQELDISPGEGGLPLHLGIAMNTGIVTFAELTSIEYMLRPSLALPLPSSAPSIPSVVCSVPKEGLAGTVAPEDFRFLGKEPTGFGGSSEGNGGGVFMALVNDSMLPAPVQVFCEGGTTFGFVDLPAKPGMVVVAMPRQAGADGHVTMRVSGDAPVGCAYAVRLETLEMSDPRIPPEVQVDGGALWRYFTEGLYAPHPGPNGDAFSWTSGRITLKLPLNDAPRDVDAMLEVAGPPAPVGPIAVRMVVNGHALSVCEVQPEVRAVLKWKVPADLLQEGLNEIVFTMPVWQPSVVLGTADDRELGVMFRRLTWRIEK